MRFSCHISGKSDEWDCTACDEKRRDSRNCRNRHQVKYPILKGVKEWRSVSSTMRHVLKIGDMKFFECPVSAIGSRTWARIRLVNETTDAEHTNILHLPFPGTVLDQPSWYRDAVQIVRSERADHRRREMESKRAS